MRSAITLALALILATAISASAAAAVLSTPDGRQQPQPFQAWADASLIPVPDWPLTLHYAPCPVASLATTSYGCDDGDNIYINPASPAQERKRLLLHEIGHWFDARGLNDHDRDVFRQLALAVPGPWLNGQEGVASAGEQFAEAFSLCAMHRRWRPDSYTFWLIYWHPTARKHGRVCAFLRTVAARYTPPA